MIDIGNSENLIPTAPEKAYLDYVKSWLEQICVNLSIPASVIEEDGGSNYCGKNPNEQ